MLAQDTWQRVDSIVQRFEEAWQAGQHPTLEDYLPPEGPDRLAVLIELAHIDLERRLKAGEPVSAEEYLRRFPELAADAAALQLTEAERAFRVLQALPAMAPPSDSRTDTENNLDPIPRAPSSWAGRGF
jgi:hypothetical protein